MMAPKRPVTIYIDSDSDGEPTPKRHHTAVGSSSSLSRQQQSQPSSSAVEEPDALSLTQDVGDGQERELYGSWDNKIVGIRYYRGVATRGESVVCLREPENAYDSNAVRVMNAMGHQIGHLPRKVVQKLAPLMDKGLITLEAELAGKMGEYDCPVTLKFFGPSDARQRIVVEEELKKNKFVKATELKRNKAEAEARRKVFGFKGGRSTAGFAKEGDVVKEGDVAKEENVSTLQELAQASNVVDFRRDGDAIKTLAMDEDVLSKFPMEKQPADIDAQLLPYQLQGLHWMQAKEKPAFPEKGSSDIVQLWKRTSKGHYANVASNIEVQAAPGLASGGILADDMGLGKTLQIISLIVQGGAGPTLVVAPVTVMSNWVQQIERHVGRDSKPKVLTYHGNAKLGSNQLKDYGVVITSYGKLSSEHKGGPNKPLMTTEWRRVVLDEGHVIRNANTETAKAACSLKAQSRWVVTGTPIVNNIKDLHSMLKFLRITGGLEQLPLFNSLITRPLGTGSQRGEQLLQLVMQDLCLRRKKDMKFVDLKIPPKTEYVHRIAFRPEEKAKYDALMSEAKGALEEYQSNSTHGQKGRFQSVLERLLRLRQTCNHWTLCKDRITDLMKLLEEEGPVKLTNETRKLLQEALRIVVESQEECSVCLDSLTNAVITDCKHVFCGNCIARVIASGHEDSAACPLCRHKLSKESLVEPSADMDGGGSSEDDAENLDPEATSSSKTEALVKILQAALRDPASKVVVFSQWTSFLNILEAQVAAAGFGFTRIDGSMTATRRDQAIAALENKAETRMLLANLGVCGVGLNLVAADTVILADSWWAPAIEDQAVDRVHRLGQTRKTTVWRLIMEDSVEDRVLDVQAEKRKLVSKAFQEKGKGKKSQVTRMADLTRILS